MNTSSSAPRFLIAIDYGTTYTGVAWILTVGETPRLSDIKVVRNWPNGIDPKVPSLYTYSANSGDQWGYGIGDNAYVIRWTKLELEQPSLVEALRSLRLTLLEANHLGFTEENVLRNQIPRHVIKTPSDVMTDYLTEVALCVRRDIEAEKDPVTLTQFPIDFVITHPAVWDSRARNLTFRAALDAFGHAFPEIGSIPGTVRLVTESEACAQYTMRFALDEGVRSLTKGECFVVVDAGGGTVDLVSYRIDEASPNFRVTQVTQVSGGRYGSTRIDDAFLRYFLPKHLSPESYRALLAIGDNEQQHSQGAHVVLRRGQQYMLKKFQTVKHRFEGPSASGSPALDDAIELPDEIARQDDPSHNIRGGQLFITAAEMVKMFSESIDGTLDLINQQLVQIDRRRLKVKTIFLSGGFSQSEYLYKRVDKLAREWKFKLFRGDDSWTAVVRGAALIGLGIGCEIPPASTRCPYHVGVVLARRFAEWDHYEEQKYTDSFDSISRARDDIKWVIAKGDLVSPLQGIEAKVRIIKKVTLKGSQTGRVVLVTSSFDGPGSPPTQYSGAYAKRSELFLDYDLSLVTPDYRSNIFQKETNAQSGLTYYKVEMQLEIKITQGSAHVELVCGKTEGMLGGVGAPGYPLASGDIP
ncbi:hypothetical protein F4677DRAFT_430205 [Hypoxylon crocopeplum]|nr:hypothetical protein F4677DRAFT_430205 [Hypoxylon crocopeplum]